MFLHMGSAYPPGQDPYDTSGPRRLELAVENLLAVHAGVNVLPAVQVVGPVASVEEVVSGPAFEDVGTAQSFEVVVSFLSLEQVVGCSADQGVVAGISFGRLDGANGVIARTAHDPRGEVDHHVRVLRLGFPEDDVVIPTADEDVVGPIGAEQDGVTATPTPVPVGSRAVENPVVVPAQPEPVPSGVRTVVVSESAVSRP